MKKVLLVAILVISFMSCKEEKKEKKAEVNPEYVALQKTASSMFGKLPEVADNPENKVTDEKVVLGKKLYFDNRLSKDNKQSCNSCHNLETYGVDNLSTSPGNDGGFGTRNSPTVFNAALHMAQFWDGREPDVEAQAGGPILNPVEMAMPSEKVVVERLSKIEEYNQLFSEAFPDEEQPINYKNIQNAIGAFERKLITPSRFDDFIAGDLDALSTIEKEGLQLFISTGCVACHSGNVLGGNIYQKFGIFDDYWKYTKSTKIDEGKFEVTKKEGDKYIFKSPSLRNIEKTYPYFHDGSVKDLKEAVTIMAKLQLNKELPENELDALVAFLNSLTGELPKNI
ncbi:MAG: cytochrome-c peroxidase [Lutibacter sp.]|uniref:cytochrome-c peroxidase n=1 Tax=Lutibacter sp. TaxID=1925666 RepID=UPI0017F1EF78|nr:cytochrome-c peroxidase [Lutibacter sp.]MBT8318073.1 cytochrome-c peroxidase [Lutibacter sp.]NNJ58933.1 cytochrome-c peroxidase [Lutibacter sp.]